MTTYYTLVMKASPANYVAAISIHANLPPAASVAGAYSGCPVHPVPHTECEEDGAEGRPPQ